MTFKSDHNLKSQFVVLELISFRIQYDDYIIYIIGALAGLTGCIQICHNEWVHLDREHMIIELLMHMGIAMCARNVISMLVNGWRTFSLHGTLRYWVMNQKTKKQRMNVDSSVWQYCLCVLSDWNIDPSSIDGILFMPWWWCFSYEDNFFIFSIEIIGTLYHFHFEELSASGVQKYTYHTFSERWD